MLFFSFAGKPGWNVSFWASSCAHVSAMHVNWLKFAVGNGEGEESFLRFSEHLFPSYKIGPSVYVVERDWCSFHQEKVKTSQPANAQCQTKKATLSCSHVCMPSGYLRVHVFEGIFGVFSSLMLNIFGRNKTSIRILAHFVCLPRIFHPNTEKKNDLVGHVNNFRHHLRKKAVVLRKHCLSQMSCTQKWTIVGFPKIFHTEESDNVQPHHYWHPQMSKIIKKYGRKITQKMVESKHLRETVKTCANLREVVGEPCRQSGVDSCLSLLCCRFLNMAVQPYERMVPVARSPHSYFEPSWEVGRWSDFSDINFNWQQQFRAMERQMRDMERQMEEMFARFRRLAPLQASSGAVDGAGSTALVAQQQQPYYPERRGDGWTNGNDKWQFENPIITDRDGSRKLKLTFDVRQFRPDEISVKTVDQHLVVRAQHKEDSDTSKVYREYNRQFLLPPSINPETMKSILSPEGVLSIEAPVNPALDAPRERLVPIEHTRSQPAVTTGAHQNHWTD